MSDPRYPSRIVDQFVNHLEKGTPIGPPDLMTDHEFRSVGVEVSIAISLKRIADALTYDKDDQRFNIHDILNAIAMNTQNH
jgi:hypothetical protein